MKIPEQCLNCEHFKRHYVIYAPNEHMVPTNCGYCKEFNSLKKDCTDFSPLKNEYKVIDLINAQIDLKKEIKRLQALLNTFTHLHD